MELWFCSGNFFWEFMCHFYMFAELPGPWTEFLLFFFSTFWQTIFQALTSTNAAVFSKLETRKTAEPEKASSNNNDNNMISPVALEVVFCLIHHFQPSFFNPLGIFFLCRLFRGLRLLLKACHAFLPTLGWSMVLLGVIMSTSASGSMKLGRVL